MPELVRNYITNNFGTALSLKSLETLGRSFCICPLVHIRLTIWDGSFGKEQRLFTRLQAKINCAKKMFADLSAEDVVYHDVDSDQSLMNIIEGL